MFRAVSDIVYDLLSSQRILIREDEFFFGDVSGNINGKALGYVFGFLDAFPQARNLDIRDHEGRATMLSLLARLRPAEVARVGTYVVHLDNMANDAAVLNGMMLGGRQAVDFLRTGAPLVRWVLCFSKELEALAEERDRNRAN